MRNIFFVIGEGIFLFVAVILSCWLLLHQHQISGDNQIILKAFMVTIVVQLCIYYNNLYDFKIAENLLVLTTRLFKALGISAIIIGLIYYAFPGSVIGHGVAEASIIFCILLVILWRGFFIYLLHNHVFDQKVMVVGSGKLAQDIICEINAKPDCGYKVSAAIAEDDKSGFYNICNTVVFARDNLTKIVDICKYLKISKIIVALKEQRGNLPLEELLTCRVNGYEVLEGNTFYEMLAGKLSVTALNPAWLIFSEGFQNSWFKTSSKRVIDVLLSGVLMIVFAPLFFLTAVIIRIDSKGPVIFSQERVGQKNATYLVLKFRSMITDAERESGPIWADEEDARITRVGKVIRKLRIDELPQLWNVFKGEMSFVGPRPEREFFVQELQQQIPYYQKRHVVKPGITGWAQVSYGYGASVEDAIEKLNYDLFYIKNMSTLFDLMIILKTIKIVLLGWGR